MSSPVSLFETAARTSLGKRRAIKARAANAFWRMSQQKSIECWAPEIVLFRVHAAGPSLPTVLLRVFIAGPV